MCYLSDVKPPRLNVVQALQIHKAEEASPVFYLSGVLVFYPGADVRVQREVRSKVLKILCEDRGRRYKEEEERIQ